MSKVCLARTGGKGKKLILKVNVSAKGLPDGAANVVGLWRMDTNEIVGHTEVVKGATDAEFKTEFHIDHFMAEDLPVKFCVYSAVKDPLDDTDFVGSHETTLGSLFKKKNQEQAMQAGSLVLKVTVLADPNAPKKEKKPKVEQAKKMTSAEKALEKAIKVSIKEGGKKGQDLCGMATFGVHFFLASVDSPGDDWKLMDHVMAGMNKPVDPDGDDRKGGAADIAKILFCAGENRLLINAHVPEELKKDASCSDFLKAVCEPVKATIIEDGEFFGKAEIKLDVEAGRFPLKLKDEAIAAGFKYLREKGLILDDDSDDEINFADECGVDLNAGGEGDY